MKVHPKTPFRSQDLNISPSEFEEIMNQMIDKGLVRSFYENGELYYQLTDIGFAVGEHLVSDPKMAN